MGRNLPHNRPICRGDVHKFGGTFVHGGELTPAPRVGKTQVKKAKKAIGIKKLLAATLRCLGCHERFLISEIMQRQFRIVTDTSCICADCDKTKQETSREI